MENNILAFIDEYGDTCLDTTKENISSLFIIVAVIINSNQRATLEDGLQTIREDYFQGSEIKSSKIGNNDKRRKIILERVNALDFKCYAYIIDKNKLTGKGFQYRKSFYKFAHGIVDKELFSTIPNIKIFADEIGSGDYMKNFVNYVKKTKVPTLFDNDFIFSNSEQTNIVQLADFIAGTLSRCYDEKKKSSRSNEFMRLLENKILSVNTWPIEYDLFAYSDNLTEFDVNIRDVSIQKAKSFLYDNSPRRKPEHYEEQKIVIEYLLFYLLNIDSKRFVSSKTLLSVLNYNRDSKIKTSRNLMQNVIAPLRGKKVLIASTKNDTGGYKLPSNIKDINNFIDTFNSQVAPMLSRLKICQEVLKLASIGELDILKQDKYKTIAKIMEVLE